MEEGWCFNAYRRRESPLYVWVLDTPSRSAAFKDKSYCFRCNLELQVLISLATCIWAATYQHQNKPNNNLFHSRNALGFTRNTKLQLSVWRSRTFTSPNTQVKIPWHVLSHKRTSTPKRLVCFSLYSNYSDKHPVSVAIIQGNLSPKTFLPIYCLRSRTRAKYRPSDLLITDLNRHVPIISKK